MVGRDRRGLHGRRRRGLLSLEGLMRKDGVSIDGKGGRGIHGGCESTARTSLLLYSSNIIAHTHRTLSPSTTQQTNKTYKPQARYAILTSCWIFTRIVIINT